jgi:hypothetical protein
VEIRRENAEKMKINDDKQLFAAAAAARSCSQLLLFLCSVFERFNLAKKLTLEKCIVGPGTLVGRYAE